MPKVRLRSLSSALLAGVASVALSGAAPGPAPVPSRIVGDAFVSAVREHLSNPIVVRSIESSNETRRGISQAEIDALDQRWRAERESREQFLIAMTLANPLSGYLTRIQAHSAGAITEIIVVDASGLNVGQSSVTSDYWQGDEAKFQKTYPVGPRAVFLDEAEYHEGTGTWRAQLNLTVADEAGRAIGAATFEVNLTELSRRKAFGL